MINIIGWIIVNIFNLIASAAWIAGIVIAQGFWSTFFAVIIPFWGWYLLAERVLAVNGLI